VTPTLSPAPLPASSRSTVTHILAIDPGETESAFVYYDVASRRPEKFGKKPNGVMLASLSSIPRQSQMVVEMIASYGMPVGRRGV
jgi:hypothetical protein